MKMESLFKEIVCPIDAEWKFNKADLMNLKENECLIGKYYFAYNIPGLQYFITIYPNGDDEDSGETWLYFYAYGSEERKVVADYTLSIESANYSEKLYNLFEDDKGCGEEVCKTVKFFESKSKYFVNGEITIQVKGILKVKQSSISRISSFISAKWKIKLDDLKENINGESKIFSKDINVESFSDIKYYLGICPRDTDERNQCTTYIYLYVDIGKQKNVEAVFSFSVDSANFNYGTQHVFDNDRGRGIPLCSPDDLFNPSKGYFDDAVLTINFHGVLMTENNRFITLNCKKEVKSATKKNEKDFIIVAEEKEIHVKKQVLSDVSPVFARMFESGMKEAIENKMYISDFPFKIVDISIKLCYGNSILLNNSLETLLSIYRFGDKYRISLIMDLIEEYLIKEISPLYVVYLIKFSSSDSFSVKKLHQSCIEFLIKCIKESTPIYAFESLDEKFVAAIVLNSLRPNLDTHIADNSDDDLLTADSTLSTDTDDTDTDDDSLTEYTTVSLLTDDTDIDD